MPQEINQTIERRYFMINFNKLKFDEKGLIPVVVQDINTSKVLMLAYMNEESLNKSIETGLAHYYSRSRQKLWLKGETSGHFQNIKEICVDCDMDTLLIIVEQTGEACHTGNVSCFYRNIKTNGEVIPRSEPENNKVQILKELYDIVSERKINPKLGSYTNYLFDKGIDKILKKVGEEAAEVIIAAKNSSNSELRYEISDLIYHLMVLMVDSGLKLEDIFDELEERRK
jgi:phosphoribosyl-AMP cyclohydrolase / phosphoribosyl-ATP pyrophosphohydrolase